MCGGFKVLGTMCGVRVTRSIVSLLISYLPTFQVLNEFFHNVCELDLVFNFYKVNSLSFQTEEEVHVSYLHLISHLSYNMHTCTPGLCGSGRDVFGGRDSRNQSTESSKQAAISQHFRLN